MPQCRQTKGKWSSRGSGARAVCVGGGAGDWGVSQGARRGTPARARRCSNMRTALLGVWSAARAWATARDAPSGHAAAGRRSGSTSHSWWPVQWDPRMARPARGPLCMWRTCSWSRGERRCRDGGGFNANPLVGCGTRRGAGTGGRSMSCCRLSKVRPWSRSCRCGAPQTKRCWPRGVLLLYPSRGDCRRH